MAVARINHDLRNMLSAAQLISDRLAAIPDPLAQRLAPRLVATLDRAIAFCQSTLTYGGGREQAPARRRFDLRELVRQVVETAEARACGRDRLRHRHPAEIRPVRRSRSRAAGDRESLPQRRAGAAQPRRAERPPAGDPLRGDSHRQRRLDRDQRQRPRIPSRADGAHFRAVPFVDARGRRRARPRHRGRPRRAQRRLDHVSPRPRATTSTAARAFSSPCRRPKTGAQTRPRRVSSPELRANSKNVGDRGRRRYACVSAPCPLGLHVRRPGFRLPLAVGRARSRWAPGPLFSLQDAIVKYLVVDLPVPEVLFASLARDRRPREPVGEARRFRRDGPAAQRRRRSRCVRW